MQPLFSIHERKWKESQRKWNQKTWKHIKRWKETQEIERKGNEMKRKDIERILKGNLPNYRKEIEMKWNEMKWKGNGWKCNEMKFILLCFSKFSKGQSRPWDINDAKEILYLHTEDRFGKQFFAASILDSGWFWTG